MMRVVLGKPTYPQKPMQDTRAFISINRAFFGKPQRQIAVGSQLALIDVQVEGAVHRFDVIFLVFDLDRRVHIFFVKAQMPAGFPEAGLADVRRVDQIVIIGNVLVIPIALDLMPNHAPIWVPQNQPLPNLVIGAVQVKFSAELAMITLFGFF